MAYSRERLIQLANSVAKYGKEKTAKKHNIDSETLNRALRRYKNEILGDKKEKVTRDSFDIFKSNTKKNKKYFVTSIIPSTTINEKFWKSIQIYCEYNQAEPILLVMRGVSTEDVFSQEVLDEYSKYFATEFIFNKNLVAKDFMLNPAQILPLTGISRYGGKNQSLLIAHSKQMMVTIPKTPDQFPHIVMSTGTICIPRYKKNRQGQIAVADNCLGGVIVEVKDDQIFFIRNIRFDGKGFQDIEMYYSPDSVYTKHINSLVCEPHIGVEDPVAIAMCDEIIDICQPKNIFLEDSADMGSVNPHTRSKGPATRLKLSDIQKTVESELDYFGEYLTRWEKRHPELNFIHVDSNHNYFLTKYLGEGQFVFDIENVKLCAELFLQMINGKNPIEYYIKKNFKSLKRQFFLKRGQSYTIHGCEMNLHGAHGANGARGSYKGIEIFANNCITAHTHSPAIYRDVIVIPTCCKLIQEYNMDGASSWLLGCAILFESGYKQILLDIYGEWRLK